MKPIIFSTPMVQATLREENPKTQTRRIVKPQPVGEVWKNRWGQWGDDYGGGSTWLKQRYSKGDVLYVRESWMPRGSELDTGWFDGEYAYKADYSDFDLDYIKRYRNAKWRPSIHMPKSAARIFLLVTDVRVEQVRQITEDDAKAEGVQIGRDNPGCGNSCVNYRTAFSLLWDSINAKRGYPWESNCWVWVYGFERIEKPEAT